MQEECHIFLLPSSQDMKQHETAFFGSPDEDTDLSSAFRLYQEPLIRFCRRLLGDAEEARDVVSDIFLQIEERKGTTKGTINHRRAWLFRCASNRCLDRLRRQKRFRSLFLNPSFLARPVLSEEVQAEHAQNREQMRQVFDQLSLRDRLLLSLYQDDLSYSEMAEASGINPASIGKLLTRAINRFRLAAHKENKQ